MLTLFTALAASAAIQAAAPPTTATAPVQRMLKDIPGVTIKYYDVEGKNPGAIKKSIAKQRPKGSDGQPVTAGFNWNVSTQITKRTEGTVCTITAAKVQFQGTAELPRLLEPQKLDAQSLKSWNEYVATLDSMEALELGYFADRMGELEKALIGHSCEKASPALDAALAKLKAEEQQFVAAQVAARTQAAAAAKKGNAPKSSKDTSKDTVDKPAVTKDQY